MSVKYGDLFNKICNRYHLFEMINVNCLCYFKRCVTKKTYFTNCVREHRLYNDIMDYQNYILIALNGW